MIENLDQKLGLLYQNIKSIIKNIKKNLVHDIENSSSPNFLQI